MTNNFLPTTKFSAKNQTPPPSKKTNQVSPTKTSMNQVAHWNALLQWIFQRSLGHTGGAYNRPKSFLYLAYFIKKKIRVNSFITISNDQFLKKNQIWKGTPQGCRGSSQRFFFSKKVVKQYFVSKGQKMGLCLNTFNKHVTEILCSRFHGGVKITPSHLGDARNMCCKLITIVQAKNIKNAGLQHTLCGSIQLCSRYSIWIK